MDQNSIIQGENLGEVIDTVRDLIAKIDIQIESAAEGVGAASV